MAFRPILLAGLLTLGACSSPEEMAEKIEQTGEATAKASAQAGGASALKVENDQLAFGYSYPAQVGAIPALAAMLDSEARQTQAELEKTTAAEKVEAQEAGFPFRAHSYEMGWKVVAETPQFLSLSGDYSTYTGGAHGMYGIRSLVWDKRTGRALDGAQMFVSPAALDRALENKLCNALNSERAERRGGPVEAGPIEEFSRCVSTAEATVLVGSSNGTVFDRIGIWYGPYVAGSYAEGAYELDFPVDAAVMRAVKPVYRAAFAPVP